MNEIRCLMKVTLVPLDSSKPTKGPFTCGFFRAFPEEFYGYPDAQEIGDPMIQDMRGAPYVLVAEVVVELAGS